MYSIDGWLEDNPTVTDCTFSGNSAVESGGGVYNNGCDPTFTGCTFSGNSADGAGFGSGGGGMNNISNSSPTLINCIFSGNTGSCGSGISNNNSSPTVTDCTFTGNLADDFGGGILNLESSSILTDCSFSGNTASLGGGGMWSLASDVTLSSCTFSGNSTNGDGGGISHFSGDMIVISCRVTGNSADRGGGIFCEGPDNLTVANCIFSGNLADDKGGGMYNDETHLGINPTVTDCTFSSNSADNGGGGMYNRQSDLTVSNCIIWGNTATYGDGIFNESCTPVISYSDISDCFIDWEWDDSLGTDGGGNIEVDPMFVDADGVDGAIGTIDDDLRLMPGSPCIDAGDNGAVTEATDLDGRIRIVDGDGDGVVTVDMGAYEAQVIYVDRDAVGANDGGNWGDAFVNLYDALGEAVWGDEIRVAEGTYLPDTTGFANARDAAFALVNGVTVRGGYAGYGAVDPDERDIGLYETILSGDLLGNDDPATPVEELLSDPNRADNCYHVFYHPGGGLDPSAVLDGFTIIGGNANGGLSYSDYGGGMYNRADSNPTVSNCTFSGHSAAMKGGGMFNVVSSPVVTGCTFIGNSANHGGGMYASSSNMTVTNCVFSTNLSILAGGGMHNMESNSTVSNCSFIGNSAKYGFGGGIFNNSSNLTVSGCTFSDNSSNEGGGGMCNWSSSPTVTDCTFNGNSANWEGGGMNNSYSSSPTMTNCSFSDNSASSGGGMYNDSSSPAIMGCHFVDNSALGDGGGMHNTSSSPIVADCIFIGNSAVSEGGGMSNMRCSPTVVNCTFSGNSADCGGGMYSNRISSIPVVNNCILWGNTAISGSNEIYGDPVISYCDIAGSGGSGGGWDINLGTDGGGNIDVDPEFVDPNGADGVIGTEDDNLRLMPGSPCIDAGDNGAVTEATDLDGLGRIVDGDCDLTATVDMGAYEFDWLYLGDFAGGCDVNLMDLGVLAESFGGVNAAIDIWPYPAGDGVIDLGEFAVVAEYWLEGTGL